MAEKEYSENELLRKAIDLLSRREYSKAELALKFERLASQQTSEAVLHRLEELGYQSEQRFVESFVRMRVSQGHGLVRIRFDLSRKGITDDLLNEVLEGLNIDWYGQARELYARKYTDPLDVKDYKGKAKRMRFMAQRGYTMDEIHYAMDAESGA
ncbi:MAG: recombinase RecA [Neptuniibacter caesariensis]|uniref:Regulatory protein RecX n=1 Tax=Neptuniibacter caesariensis TaxID=207954 RepID=A0A2G6JQZ4_NEPCE|nr:MAG: recombinase RecA [Neptuniibacter caesariensis]